MQAKGKIPARGALVTVFLVAWSLSAAAQGVVSLRNNILWDATGTPNLGIEFKISDHATLGFNGAFKPWPRFLAWDNDQTKDARWRHLTLAPEFRWYTKEANAPGLFFGADLVYSHFNLGAFNVPIGPYADLQVHRIQGDIYGGTAFIGYGWGLSKHFRLEVEAGAGAGYRNATEYECAHCGAEVGPSNGVTFVPKAGVNIVWNIEGRKKIRRQIIDIVDTPAQIDTVAAEIPAILDTVVRVVRPKIDTISTGRLLRGDVDLPVQVVEEVKTEPEVETVTETVQVRPDVQRHPLLRPISDYKAYTSDRVLNREEGNVPVWFQFAKYNLLRSVYVRGKERDNGEGLDTIENVIKDALADEAIDPTKVQIVGFASIDGNQWGNERLALRRANAVKSYIKWKTGLPDEAFEVVCGGEAWSELMDELAQRQEAGEKVLTDAEYERVRKIVDSVKDLDTRELRIKELSGGAIYQKLLTSLFADQRSAVCVRVFYDDADPNTKSNNINE